MSGAVAQDEVCRDGGGGEWFLAFDHLKEQEHPVLADAHQRLVNGRRRWLQRAGQAGVIEDGDGQVGRNGPSGVFQRFKSADWYQVGGRGYRVQIGARALQKPAPLRVDERVSVEAADDMPAATFTVDAWTEHVEVVGETLWMLVSGTLRRTARLR